ncbi:MAG: hypothetical protein Q7S52_03095 [bacterium]|nr:hypothetical protein [bacterium]
MFFFKKINSPVILHVVSVCLIVLMIATMTFVALPKKAEAQSPPFIPFGGLSLSVTWCPCSFNLWIIVGPPRGGSYMFQFGGSMLYLFGQIFRPGAWLLGLASPTPVACLIPVPHGCAPIGWGLPILIVGTSM